jgi:hypothetical protein
VSSPQRLEPTFDVFDPAGRLVDDRLAVAIAHVGNPQALEEHDHGT